MKKLVLLSGPSGSSEAEASAVRKAISMAYCTKNYIECVMLPPGWSFAVVDATPCHDGECGASTNFIRISDAPGIGPSVPPPPPPPPNG